MTRVHPSATLAALLLLPMAIALVPGPAVAQDGDEALLRLKQQLAAELVDLAEDCKRWRQYATARRLANQALELVEGYEDALEVLDDVGDHNTDSDGRGAERYERALRRAGSDLAGMTCALVGALVKADDEGLGEHSATLRRAFEFDAEEAAEWVDRWTAGAGAANPTAALEALDLAQQFVPDDDRAEARRLLELRAAETTPIKRTASSHPMQYWLTLPRNWTPDREWWVLVACEGAGANYLGQHRQFLRQRGDAPLILITPIGFSNVNAINPDRFPYPPELIERFTRAQGPRIAWDEEGLLAVLADLREEFNAHERFLITGYSGGGLLAFRMTMRFPERVPLLAVSCGNFASPLLGQCPAPDDPAKPIRVLQGRSDQYLESILNPNWADCTRTLARMGYTNVEREMLDGGHRTYPREIIDMYLEAVGETD